MIICYHKEFFGAGMLVALFLFEAVILFGDAIEEWFKKLYRSLIRIIS